MVDIHLGTVRAARATLSEPTLDRSLGGYRWTTTLTFEPDEDLTVLNVAGTLHSDEKPLALLGARPDSVPITRGRDARTDFQLDCFISPEQLRAVEEGRHGDMRFYVVARMTIHRGGSFHAGDIKQRLRVSQSDWLRQLDGVGFFESLLLEIAVPSAQENDAIARACLTLAEARARLAMKGTSNVFGSLKALVDDLDKYTGARVDPGALARKGLGEWSMQDRMDNLRAALRRLVGVGEHGGDAREVVVSDAAAEAAFVIACGLTRWYAANGPERRGSE